MQKWLMQDTAKACTVERELSTRVIKINRELLEVLESLMAETLWEQPARWVQHSVMWRE